MIRLTKDPTFIKDCFIPTIARIEVIHKRHGTFSKIDPLSIDNECNGLNILPKPILTDGHHRYLAHLFLGHEKMEIEYSGRMDILTYLIGKGEIEQ